MKKTGLWVAGILLLAFVFNSYAQSPALPVPYGDGVFYSWMDPVTGEGLPFFGTPAYGPSADSVYAAAGPDSGQFSGYYLAYSLQSDLNDTSVFYQYPIFPDSSVDSDSPVPAPAVGNDGTTYFLTENGILYAIYPNGNEKWVYFGIAVDGFEGRASPTIGLDGNIYVATDDSGGVFYCIDPDLGLPKWKLRLSGLADMDASPLFTTSGIYDVDEGGELHFITPYGQEYTPLATGSGTFPGSSPAITGQGLICVGTGDGFLELIDPITRQIVQTTAQLDGSSIYGSPVIGPDGNIYVGTSGNNFFAVSLQTSPPTVIAETSLAGKPTTATIGSDGTVYVGTSSGGLQTGSSGSLYSLSLQPVSGGSYPYQFVINWQTNFIASPEGGVTGSPLLAQVGASHNNNVVYDGSMNGVMYAFKASSGPSTTTWSTFQGNVQRQGSWGSGPISPAELWSVQFGPMPLYLKTGKAAYGNSSGDYWNGAIIPTPNNPPNPYILTNSIDDVSGNRLHCAVFLYSGSGFRGLTMIPAIQPFNDNLMKNAITANGTFTLELQAPNRSGFNGGPALYDIYVYAYGGQATHNGTAYSYNSTISISTPGTDPVTGNQLTTLTTSSIPPSDLSHFDEGFEYVVFRNVPFTSNNYNFQITVSKDPNDPISFPLVNGIQIVAKQ